MRTVLVMSPESDDLETYTDLGDRLVRAFDLLETPELKAALYPRYTGTGLWGNVPKYFTVHAARTPWELADLLREVP